jgi:hypothetical protein
MRRFAEFGILPGYEFPNEPCTLRLRNDPHEEDPIPSNDASASPSTCSGPQSKWAGTAISAVLGPDYLQL